VVNFPPSEEFVAEGICEVSRGILLSRGEYHQGDLGYGREFENDVFMMHPYCWCEKPDCPWCRGCACLGHDDPCDNCVGQPHRAPNFLFKPTGAEVSWYKYIGRGMVLDDKLPHTFVATCLESL
jgi:hypothetical protein